MYVNPEIKYLRKKKKKKTLISFSCLSYKAKKNREARWMKNRCPVSQHVLRVVSI